MPKNSSPYNAAITREQFLFFETRTTARLLNEGFSKDEAVQKIIDENLFQYPTEKSLKKMANCCLRRLECLGDNSLIKMLATRPVDEAKQICLYAMMCQYRLIWDFMITVVGEKYKKFDTSFGNMDLNVFFMQLQEQDDLVASWSETTVKKIGSVLMRVLIENEYIESSRSNKLQPVLLSHILENAIRNNGEELALAAFNCF